jgi:hypothetical protein
VYATVGGGEWNEASGIFSTVAGGQANTASGGDATVAGGFGNEATQLATTVCGGGGNRAVAMNATIAGGRGNEATGEYGFIGGGGGAYGPDGNLVTDDYGVVGGGNLNQAGNGNQDGTDAQYASVGGGYSNAASGWYSTVPGGYDNTAQGSYSFAAGRQARAYYNGCFVWGDGSTTNDVACYGPNRTVFRNAGGIWIYTNSTLTSGVYLTAGDSSWNMVSDRQTKENFQTVDAQELLARLAEIPIPTWNYKAQDPSIRHIGPMAQDFNALVEDLGGEGEKYIDTLDADGVALAAIQGLYQLAQDQEQQITELEARIAALEQAGGVAQAPKTGLAARWLLLPGLVVAGGVWLQKRRSGGGP